MHTLRQLNLAPRCTTPLPIYPRAGAALLSSPPAAAAYREWATTSAPHTKHAASIALLPLTLAPCHPAVSFLVALPLNPPAVAAAPPPPPAPAPAGPVGPPPRTPACKTHTPNLRIPSPPARRPRRSRTLLLQLLLLPLLQPRRRNILLLQLLLCLWPLWVPAGHHLLLCIPPQPLPPSPSTVPSPPPAVPQLAVPALLALALGPSLPCRCRLAPQSASGSRRAAPCPCCPCPRCLPGSNPTPRSHPLSSFLPSAMQ